MKKRNPLTSEARQAIDDYTLAKEFGWDYDIISRQPEDWIAGLLLVHRAINTIQAESIERMKQEPVRAEGNGHSVRRQRIPHE